MSEIPSVEHVMISFWKENISYLLDVSVRMNMGDKVIQECKNFQDDLVKASDEASPDLSSYDFSMRLTKIEEKVNRLIRKTINKGAM